MVNQLIEAEVEKKIKEKSFKEDAETNLNKRLLQDDTPEDDEEKLKALYKECLELLTQADKNMKKKKNEKDQEMRRQIERRPKKS